MPGLQEPDLDDIRVVGAQIGREPRGRVLVAARCPHGAPAVILTVPFESDEGALPPLLWLTCPSLCFELSRLESAGGIERLRAQLESGEAAEVFTADEEAFGRILLALAESRGPGLVERTGRRGAAGGRPGSIKCLHAHVAYRLASGSGVAGGLCLDEIERRSGRWCERIPDVCVT